MAWAVTEIVLVKFEVKCLSVCLSVYLSMADHSGRSAYGLGSDHRKRSEQVW